MKKERAALTVEASLVLTLFMFFVLFLLSFNRVYSAQNIMSHATLQAADAISAESMLRVNANTSDQGVANILTVSNHIYNGKSVEAAALEKLTADNISDIAKKDFIAAVAESEAKADEVLKKNGVKDGIEGIDFSGCEYFSESGESIVFVKYTVELQFPIFGLKEFPMTKAAKVTNMGKDTYVVTVKAQNPAQGSTSGTVRVRKGSDVTIYAYPANGYEFDHWIEDGSTANPKKITVNNDLTFTAVFRKAKYTVSVKVYKDGWGKVSGTKETYHFNDVVTLTAVPTPEEGYEFLGWDEDGHEGIDAGEETSRTFEFRVRRDFSVTARFKAKPKKLYVSTGGNGKAQVKRSDYNGGYTSTSSDADNSISYTWDYGTEFLINAVADTGYEFSGWSLSGIDANKDASNADLTCILRDSGDGTATAKANFKPIKYKITVATGGYGAAVLNGSKTNTDSGDTVSQMLEYGSSFTISADGDFTGWNGTPNNSANEQTLTVPIGGATYTAYFAEPKKYDGSKAAEYAIKYCKNYNSDYASWATTYDYERETYNGKDCANFVSQCLYAGGLEITDGWYPGDPKNNKTKYSDSWIGVKKLKSYLVDTLGYQYISKPSVDQLSVGDVMIYNNEGHTAIVVEVGDGYAKVCSHTSDRYYSTWKMGFSDYNVIKMNG